MLRNVLRLIQCPQSKQGNKVIIYMLNESAALLNHNSCMRSNKNNQAFPVQQVSSWFLFSMMSPSGG